MRSIPSFVLLVVLASVAAARPAFGETPPDIPTISLDVPYLPQTERLCGGAAAAMVLRYWGDRHANPQAFAPLINDREGGIENTRLVQALQDRHWQATTLAGSITAIETELAAGHPLILLLQDRPRRFHYVVVTGTSADRVWIHDPTWGPSRTLTHEDLLRAWQPAGFWSLRVQPDGAPGPSSPSGITDSQSLDAPSIESASGVSAESGGRTSVLSRPAKFCERAVQDALDISDLDRAGERLVLLTSECPRSSTVLSELAGVRFGQRRFDEAAGYATEAVRRDATNRYAWDVLGSSLFLEDRTDAALRAWNHIDKPRLDAVRITGLSRTRYSLVTDDLSLKPGEVLTAGRYRLAERRLHDLPDVLSTRLFYRPDADGFATLDVSVAERPHRPDGLLEWSAAGTNAAVNRELRVTVPGWSGAGSVWSSSWRWLEGQPRAEMTFAAPRAGILPGIWHVTALWEAETYAAVPLSSDREARARAEVGMSNWLTAHWRYGLVASVDALNAESHAIAAGGSLERRWADDRVSAIATVQNWKSIEHVGGFLQGSGSVTLQSSVASTGLRHSATVNLEAASTNAPRLFWPGAGEGRMRDNLLRAHPLVHDGAIDGPAFGRRLVSMTVESQRWFERASIIPIGAAVFADLARAWQRPVTTVADPFQLDLGAGLRIKAPGRQGALHIDVAHGLRDGANALTVGWRR